nr:MAG TPA: hypothetical protein [Caudoviricetes sp.]
MLYPPGLQNTPGVFLYPAPPASAAPCKCPGVRTVQRTVRGCTL